MFRRVSIFLLLLATIGCDRSDTPRPTTPATTRPTVASLVPAATDLIIAMNATDQLVGVSSYDRTRKEASALPAVGDYLHTDWEELATLKPTRMIIQMQPDRLPVGFTQNADRLSIGVVNVKIDRLDDIFKTIDQLGNALDAKPKSDAMLREMHRRLDVVSARAKTLQLVPTLLVLNESGDAAVGSATYLDDLLQVAGGTNVAAKLGKPYPVIDREMLLSLQPAVIIQLLPGANQSVLEAAKRQWASMPSLPAVKTGRVTIITDDYALLPGSHVCDLAEKFFECLHPSPPTSQPHP